METNDREFMHLAILEAKKSVAEDEHVHTRGVLIVHSLVQQSLAGNTEPFLTSSRLVEDLRQIKQRLAMGIAGLSTDDLTALFPVALFLQGYEVAGEDTLAGRHFWEIQFSDPGGILYSGIGALVKHVDDLRGYKELMNQYGYVSGVFYLTGKASLPTDSVPDRVNVMGRDDLTALLMAIAMTEYVDTFALTISSLGLREKVRDTLVQEAGLSWETIMTISRRWAIVAEDLPTHWHRVSLSKINRPRHH